MCNSIITFIIFQSSIIIKNIDKKFNKKNFVNKTRYSRCYIRVEH